MLVACPSEEIVYLECPVYSMKMWNALHGERESEGDKELEDKVEQLNTEIRRLYGSYIVPKFSLDLLKNTKNEKGHYRYFYNYKDLYIDNTPD